MNRKNFLHLASASAAGILFGSIEQDLPALPPGGRPGYQLVILATNWGFKGSLDEFCAAAKKEGYDGVEIWWPNDARTQQEMFAAVQKHSLSLGIILGGWQQDYNEHLATFRKVTTDAASNIHYKPLYINCHSGRDYFSVEQNQPFIEHTITLSKQSGILICHETHRGRIHFAAHITRDYLQKFPELRLTFDVSHWCNVHESLLDDQEHSLKIAIDRSEHIHARVGYAEGPQVNDPRAPEWKQAVEKHIAWWDQIATRKKQKGETLTILTEFGPADYMNTIPYTRQPLSDQWAINVHMMNLLRKRYQ